MKKERKEKGESVDTYGGRSRRLKRQKEEREDVTTDDFLQDLEATLITLHLKTHK